MAKKDVWYIDNDNDMLIHIWTDPAGVAGDVMQDRYTDDDDLVQEVKDDEHNDGLVNADGREWVCIESHSLCEVKVETE